MKPVEAKARKPLKIAVLISGTGRSLNNMVRKIDAGELNVEIKIVVANTPSAKGLQYAEKSNIPIRVLDRKQYGTQDEYSQAMFALLRTTDVELVVLAGFIKRLTIPDDYANRVVNIHPSLVPSFCGKGFYGHHVHEAAIAYGVKVSGCTVHFVDNEYDHGPVILQKAVPVQDDDTLDTLEARVFAAECIAYPEALQLIAEGRVRINGRLVRISANGG
jgi:formyltetrahydrofolate-dependent phosphoribosylglycinamide formyltransferase